MSLFAQGSNKKSFKKLKQHKRNTHTKHKKNIKIKNSQKNYKVKEFTNVVRISNFIFAADKVRVEIPY